MPFWVKRKNEGFALVAVLWAVALLSLMAVGTLASGGSSYRMARNEWMRIRGGALADAAVQRAVLGMTDSRIDKRWRVDGVPIQISFGDAKVTIRLQDELGRIDLNAAEGNLLTNLFVSAGLSEDHADALVDKILDWRDSSSTKRLQGAKAAEYAAAGYGYGPRNGPFQSVDELKLVMGMTAELFQRVSPALTVYSGRATIDSRNAPREVLLALPTMDANGVNDVMAERTAATTSLGDPQSALPGVLGADVPLAGRAFSIVAEVIEADHQWRREEVVRLTGDPQRLFLVLSWK